MLTFIDESGYPRPTDSTKNPILLGVCVHENDIKPITNQIYKLKIIYLNNFLFDFIQIWCIILLESYVVPSWSCVGLVILTKVSHLQFKQVRFFFVLRNKQVFFN